MGKKVCVVRNEEVKEVIIGIPFGNEQLRVVIRLEGRDLIFHEALIAGILRAFVIIKTHPQKRAIALKTVKLLQRKDGYAERQLIETERTPEEVEVTLKDLLEHQ